MVEVSEVSSGQLSKVWYEVFGDQAAPPRVNNLEELELLSTDELRRRLKAIKATLDETKEGVFVSILVFKSGAEVNHMVESNPEVDLPFVEIASIDDYDRGIATAEGVEVDSLVATVASRILQDDSTTVESIFNAKRGELNKIQFIEHIARALVNVHKRTDIILEKQIRRPQENSSFRVITDEIENQALTLMLSPRFLTGLIHQMRNDVDRPVLARPFQLILYPVSKRVLLACDAYCQAGCEMLTRASLDRQTGGVERINGMFPCILADEAAFEQLVHSRKTLITENDEVDVPGIFELLKWVAYPLRSAVIASKDKKDMRHPVVARQGWGGYFEPYEGTCGKRRRRGLCSACGTMQGDIKLCSKCGRAGYCNSECQKTAWPNHRLLCEELEKKTAFYVKRGTPELHKAHFYVYGTPSEEEEIIQSKLEEETLIA